MPDTVKRFAQGDDGLFRIETDEIEPASSRQAEVGPAIGGFIEQS